MSIATPLSLDIADGTVKSFKRLSTVAGQSDWIREDTNLTEPIRMLIRHSVSGSGANAIDRHNVHFDLVKIDSAGVPRTLKLDLSFSVPRSSVITSSLVKDVAIHGCNFLTDQSLAGGVTTFTSLEDLLIGVM